MAATTSFFDIIMIPAILNFGCRLTSDKVDKVISMSGIVENMGVEVGISAPSITVEKLFTLRVSVAGILNSVDGRRRDISGNVDNCRAWSKMWG